MSIVVPRAPSHDEAGSVFAQLDELSSESFLEGHPSKDERRGRALMFAAVVIGGIGVLLHVGALTLLHAPQSGAAQFVLFVCKALFKEVCA